MGPKAYLQQLSCCTSGNEASLQQLSCCTSIFNCLNFKILISNIVLRVLLPGATASFAAKESLSHFGATRVVFVCSQRFLSGGGAIPRCTSPKRTKGSAPKSARVWIIRFKILILVIRFFAENIHARFGFCARSPREQPGCARELLR